MIRETSKTCDGLENVYDFESSDSKREFLALAIVDGAHTALIKDVKITISDVQFVDLILSSVNSQNLTEFVNMISLKAFGCFSTFTTDFLLFCRISST